MPSIPSHIARVPNALSSQVMLSSLQNTSRRLLNVQLQLATGRLVNRPSDDAVAASSVAVLDDILERRDQRLRNLSHGEAVLNTTDAALADANELLMEARAIGLGQIGVGSDAATRKNQAAVIDSMLRELVNISNRQYQDVFLFGGQVSATQPMNELLGGYRYAGQGGGMVTDLGLPSTVPVTTSAQSAFGSLSARVHGERDLDPRMTLSTRLADLNGARGRGVVEGLGSINVDVGGTDLTVDLSNAHSVGDVAQLLQDAIQTIDAGATVGIDAVTGNRFEITGNTVAITISDLAADATAADLGLNTTFAIAGGTGNDVDPRITLTTPLAALNGVTVPLGTIRLQNAGQTRDLDLSSAVTVQDVVNAVKALNIGIRVEIGGEGEGGGGGDRLNFINELSSGAGGVGGMSVGELAGGTTATQLGVRSLTGSTLLAHFNNGVGGGVEIKTGSVDPITGLPDPAHDVDFRITLKNGTAFDVDLEDVTTVQDVLDQINAAAAGAGLAVPADFEAALAATGNGIALTDGTAGPPGAETTVAALNGSFAAEHLGILGSTTSATFTGEDRATVAVESVFSHLMALRDALLGNDERGIGLATNALEGDLDQVTQARAEVGVRSQRVAAAITREQDLVIQDTALKSELQDLDYTEASVRFSTLQTQLQAGLLTTSRASNLSLLDFLR